MDILYYDCFCGISGDMNLGALIDAGVPADYLESELKKLKIDGYDLQYKKHTKMGISGTLVNIETEETHAHRSFGDIKHIISESLVSEYVKQNSINTFYILGQAEAKVHSKPIDEIHFHEVGAIDAIIDIVGAAICMEYLNPKKIICSTVETGGGFVRCAHGNFPVPAPATAEILNGIPVKKGGVNSETTTPTGAAILKNYVTEYTDNISFTIEKTSYGIGHKDFEVPNVLRVYSAKESSIAAENGYEAEIILECNIDDMPPERYEFIIDKLLYQGAKDVTLIPCIMKKSRPATELKVLCKASDKMSLENTILRETTTLGVRSYPIQKRVMERKTNTISTKYGDISVKFAYDQGEIIKYKAEYEDCKKAAIEHNKSLQQIYSELEFILINK